MSGKASCSAPGCSSATVARRLCRKHYQAAWKAGELASEPTVPRVRARTVCPPEHRHAVSSTCYIQHQCRCEPCRDAHTEMAANRRRLKAYGRFDTGLVDAEPVREHLLMLGAFGLGYKRIADLAGVGITAARNILWGRQAPGGRYGELPKRILRENAEKLLAVKPDIRVLPAGATIPARGAHRRVQALVARGWSMSKIASRVGMNRANFGAMMQRDGISVRNHWTIAAVFDELWDVEPPHEEHRDKIAYTRALGHARTRRWLPPLAWDDIDNDTQPPLPDTEGGIDDIAVQLAVTGDQVRLTTQERREAVRRLHTIHLSDTDTAARLHVDPRTILRIRQELALPAAVGADGAPIIHLPAPTVEEARSA